MGWPTFEQLSALIRLPQGYRFEFLRPSDVPTLAAAIGRWHPDIAIGGGSCFLREDFYANHVCFEGGPDRDVMVVVFVWNDEIVGMWSMEKEPDTLVIYARLIVIGSCTAQSPRPEPETGATSRRIRPETPQGRYAQVAFHQ